MSLDVEVANDGVRVALASARVAALACAVLRAERVRSARLSIAFVGARAIASMNRVHLGHAGRTDVISFPFARAAAGAPLGGDVYIAPAVARANAVRLRVPVREELARLVVHATLHVLGYEHPEDERRTTSRMWLRQEQLLWRFAQEWRA